MRYKVNQEYPFITVLYQHGPEHGFFPGFLPWTDTLIDIEINVLTCVDEQKVRDHWADKKSIFQLEADKANGESDVKYEGYAFEDRFGRLWFTNYHRYSCGQTTTTSHLAFLAERKFDRAIRRCEYLVDFVEDILKGIEDLRKQGKDEWADQLETYFKQIDEALFSSTGMRMQVCDKKLGDLYTYSSVRFFPGQPG